MIALALAVILCWLIVLAARPRKPLPGNEVQELVYSRLLGRQQTIALLMLFVTAMLLLVWFVTLPQRLDSDLRTVRQAQAACIAARQAASDAGDNGITIRAHCYEMQVGGTWAEKVEQSDGTWLLVATLASPPLFTRPTAARGGTMPPLKP